MQNRDNPHIWVVVADRAVAKIFKVSKFPKVTEIFHMEHPESKMLNQDLVSSKQGCAFQSVGDSRSTYQARFQPKQLEAAKFAIDVADHLALAQRNGEFNRLYIFAEPTFLGLLRKHFNAETRKTIVAEIPKELIPSDISSIERHLEEI